MAPTRIPGIALLIVAGALSLSACAPASGGDLVPGTSGAPGSGASGATGVDDDGRTAVTAITTAEASAGGRAFELERGDDDTWEVHVAVGEREVEVRVASEGTSVQSSQDDDAVDADERAALDAAVTTLADAVRIATAQNPGGERLDEVQLDEDDGTWIWKVEVRDGTTVRIAAADGAVL
ncbi:putative membrane protein YkoI [Microbacterium proteolyticum]|uniref:Putative membrane protein YkoI n=1 Tax=Microbacterium proteolyticum TaxID=1572644 RepID=A0A7W5CG34_9MICO|nr:PepSY domain-containing protein [Microbacterium proteolyticum]MBB3156982.1 putative membrane protein YkoI [Microbacterium proteolyticum]